MNQKILLLLLSLLASVSPMLAQGTAFLYQGRLNDAGSPANANYDFRFAIYTAVTNGTAISYPITNSAVPVSNGLFAVSLDFGTGVFTGSNYWLDLGVRAVGLTNFTALLPRQPILPVPYAIFANTASNLVGSLSANQVVGTLSSAQLPVAYTNAVNFTSVSNTFAGAFAGNAAALTNLNASQLIVGTVADARLTTNVALLNTNQTFTGINNFTNATNSFAGSFFGNGLVGWIPTNGTSVQATRDHGYMLTSAGFTTVTLPASSNLLTGDIVRISGAGAGGWQAVVNTNQSIMGNFNSYRIATMLTSGNGGDWRCLASSASGLLMFAAGTLTGEISASANSGQTWNPVPGVVGGGWVSIACSADGTKVYVAPNSNAGILMSTNGGATFPSSIGGNAYWKAVACSADGSRVIAGASGSQLALTHGTSPALANWTAVASSNDGTNLAAAAGTTIYTSTNGGYNWISSSLSGSCSALIAADSGFRLMAAANNGIYTSTNFGANWSTNVAPVNSYSCLAGSSDCTRLVAGVSNGLLYASANFGATWSAVTSTNQAWTGVGMSADGSKFAATCGYVGGSGGGIFYSSTSQQANSTTNSIVGSQGAAVELQFIGNNQFMPVSSTGTLWSN